jgi:hypothetical protein
MWPQLEAILRPYVFSPDQPPSRLLFPSRRGSGEAMLTDFRKPLLRVSLVAGFTEPLQRGGEVLRDKQGQPVLRSTIGFKTCRHTYGCARLATLDRGPR